MYLYNCTMSPGTNSTTSNILVACCAQLWPTCCCAWLTTPCACVWMRFACINGFCACRGVLCIQRACSRCFLGTHNVLVCVVNQQQCCTKGHLWHCRTSSTLSQRCRPVACDQPVYLCLRLSSPNMPQTVLLIVYMDAYLLNV